MTSTYYETFYPDTKDAADRLILRVRTVAGLVGIDPNVIPAVRDAWIEKHRSADDPERGHLLIAIYTEAREDIRRHASGIFAMRAHERYSGERDDTVAPTYLTFYFRVPAEEMSEATLASLVGAAVEPVDTDARWAAALGPHQEGNR